MLAYVVNFIAADPEYDWAKTFGPASPAYLPNIKVAKTDEIEEAMIKLQAKIKSDTKAMTKKERRDTEVDGKDVNPDGVEARPCHSSLLLLPYLL